MGLNDYRDEAARFITAIAAGEEDPFKILVWLEDELEGLKNAADRRDLPALRHQIYDLLFLLLELAARFDLDMDAEWAAGRERKRTKYIERIRNLARLVAKNYINQREEMGYPLLKDKE